MTDKGKTDRSKTAKPSARLAAQKPVRKQHAPSAKDTQGDSKALYQIRTGSFADAMPNAADASLALVKPTKMQVATKFVVTQKTEVPVVVGRERQTRWHVKLEAAYEARSILGGLATEQGNADNRIFGDDQPDAEIRMVIHSKAIADTFQTGHAFGLVFTELAG